jgi:uncharacterized damage-inducible protein DinB
VSELVRHIAQSSHGIGAFVARSEQPDFKQMASHERELIDKAALLKELKAGFAYARKLTRDFDEKKLEETQRAWWGTLQSKRFFLEMLARHAAEHLGQLTIYARMNGVVPPWRIPEKQSVTPPEKSDK